MNKKIMQEKIKIVGIIFGAALILFLAGFLGSILALKSFEPEVKLLVARQSIGANILNIIDGVPTLSGKVVKINGNVITIETEPPQDPFFKWQKEMEIVVDEDATITSGSWKSMAEAVSSNFSYASLKEAPMTIGEIELGRIVIVVPSGGSVASGRIETRKIIVGALR